MPSPIGHALAGASVALAFAPPSSRAPDGLRVILGAALLAAAPDLDLLGAVHRGPTHSLAAAVFVGLTVWTLLRAKRSDAARVAAICAAAWGTHVLLDWLGTDTSPPTGLMVWWPFTNAYFEAPVHVFSAVSRRFRQPQLFWLPNLLALARELLILGPVFLLAYWRRLRLEAPAVSGAPTSPRQGVRPE